MAQMKVKGADTAKPQAKSGYWMYKDGHSYWGIGIMRRQEVPVMISKEQHAMTKDEKLASVNAPAEETTE